jgi:hypothetical protein
MSVVGGAENIARLVEEKVKFTLNSNTPALDFDEIDNGVHADALLVHTPAVNRHPTLGNQPLARAART